MFHIFGVVSKKSSLHPRSSRVSPMFSRNFMALHFAFKSMIYFTLIFVLMQDLYQDSYFYMWMSNYSSIVCCKDSVCSIVLLLLLCQSSTYYIYESPFLTLLLCSTVCLLFHQYHNVLITILFSLFFLFLFFELAKAIYSDIAIKGVRHCHVLSDSKLGRGMGKLMVEKREGFRCTLMAVGIGQL